MQSYTRVVIARYIRRVPHTDNPFTWRLEGLFYAVLLGTLFGFGLYYDKAISAEPADRCLAAQPGVPHADTTDP